MRPGDPIQGQGHGVAYNIRIKAGENIDSTGALTDGRASETEKEEASHIISHNVNGEG